MIKLLKKYFNVWFPIFLLLVIFLCFCFIHHGLSLLPSLDYNWDDDPLVSAGIYFGSSSVLIYLAGFTFWDHIFGLIKKHWRRK